MLVTKSKSRDRNATQAEMVYLVPELCRATGAFFHYIAFYIHISIIDSIISHDKAFFLQV